MTGRTIAITICLAAIATRSHGQELGIELNGGLQGTQYQLRNGTVTPLPGGSLGLTYTFRLAPNWGLVTGITGGIYRTQARLHDSAFTYSEVDDAGSAFEFTVKAPGYTETQQFVAAGIPLLLQYHTAGPKTRWYADLGGRAVFPLSASIRQSAQQLSLSGYYPDVNIEVANLPQHGFGTTNNWKTSQTVSLKPAAVLTVSTGVSFRISNNSRLYTGLYLDYGLTPVKSDNDSLPFVTYSPTGISHVEANSVWNMTAAGKVSILSFGLQVRLSFGASKARPAPRANPRPESPEPANAPIGDPEAQVVQAPILFGALGETAISDIQQAHLDQVAAIMLRYPTIRIAIVGHICNSGTATESIKVGEERAKAVARYLENKGISRGRMAISSLQQSDPVLPNNPAANYRNRRVVITIE